MNRNFRVLAFKQLQKQAGIISDVVSKSYESKTTPKNNKQTSQPIIGTFKDKFLKLAPGPAREELVYNEITKNKPPINLVPITVTTKDGTSITYKVMPDYLTLDGIRVPMSGVTAQKVADFYNMHLPTSKMSKQIWQAADTKIRPTPLSAGGVINGKHYSGQEVVDHKISDSDSSVAYNQMINDELKNHPNANLVAGHMKDLIMPEGKSNRLGLYGWFGTDGKPIQYSARTPHDTTVHTEYGAGTRLVDNNVSVTTPDGQTTNTTLDKILNDPQLSKAISTVPGDKRYSF